MEINLTIDLNINAVTKLSKEEKENLCRELKRKIKSNLEMLMSDIPIPNNEKLLDGYDYNINLKLK